MPEVKVNGNVYDLGAEVYQSVYRGEGKSERLSWDRLGTILQAESGYNFDSIFSGDIVDWGCNMGFFSFTLAERTSGTVFGVDSSPTYYNFCEFQKNEHKISNVKFIFGEAPDVVPDVPTHLVMSVLHHQMENEGLPVSVVSKLSKAKTIYFELAHHLEYPDWARKIKPINVEDTKNCPYLYWLAKLEHEFKDFVVRLIGVHQTHLGSLRPMFQLKRKVCQSFDFEGKSYEVYDKFRMPYMDFGHSGGPGKVMFNSDVVYAYATSENKKYFVKFKSGQISLIKEYIDGLLLSDLIKFGMLPYYNRVKIKEQLLMFTERHYDPHPWNFLIDRNSVLWPIDTDENVSILVGPDLLKAYIRILAQTV